MNQPILFLPCIVTSQLAFMMALASTVDLCDLIYIHDSPIT